MYKGLLKNITIIDDHEILIEGMKSILENNKNYKVFEHYTNGNTFLLNGNTRDTDLILMDISMPGKSGLEIVKELRDNGVTIPVIMVSQYSEDEFASEALKSGANGYISKNSGKDLILKAVDTVLNGGIYISGEGIKTLYNNNEMSNTIENILKKLSERENNVLLKLCKGSSLKEISYDLNISDRTVSTYKRRIMEKLGLENLVDIIKFGIENKII